MHSTRKVKGHKESCQGGEILYTLLVRVVSWVYSNVKTHRIEHSKPGAVSIT